jgi:hypothetical protein
LIILHSLHQKSCFSEKTLYRHVGCGIAHVILTLYNIFKNSFRIKIAYIAKLPHPWSTTYHFSCVAALTSRFTIPLKTNPPKTYWGVGCGLWGSKGICQVDPLSHYSLLLILCGSSTLHPTHCSVYSSKTRIKPKDVLFTIKEI